MISKVLLGTLLLLALLAAGLAVSAYLAFDRSYSHTSQSAELPACDPASTVSPCLARAGELSFRVRHAGAGGTRGNLVLLHGFPETSIMWQPLIEAAAAAGYRVLAFDQRGYSPGARPEAVADYAIDKLVGDVFAVADAFGFERFHLVGHDWGAGVGWALVLTKSPRVQSWTSLSIPHIASFGAAIASDPEQQRKSSYMALFRTPVLPELLFAFNDFALLKNQVYGGHAASTLDEYLRVFREPGALTAALNWYRAAAFTGDMPAPEIDLPVLFIWGNQDPAVGRQGVENQRQYLRGPFREIELDAGHWLMESDAAEICEAVLRHVEDAGAAASRQPMNRRSL